MSKKKKISIITITGIITFLLLFFLTGNGELLLCFKPAKVTCPNTVEMGIGESKEILMIINKAFTLLHWNDIDVEAGNLYDGNFEQLPETITINAQSSSLSLIKSVGGNIGTYLTISASPDIEPGIYEIYLKMSALLFGEIKTIPLTLIVYESNDDVIVTSEGPIYRGNLESNNEILTPVEETTIELVENRIPLTYRDSIEMTLGGYEEIILTIGTDGIIPPEGIYTFKIIDADEEARSSVDNAFEIEDVQVTADGQNPVTTVLPIQSRFVWAVPHQLLIEVKKDSQVIGYAPLMIDVIKSPDDIIITPGGNSYRSYYEVDLKKYSIP